MLTFPKHIKYKFNCPLIYRFEMVYTVLIGRSSFLVLTVLGGSFNTIVQLLYSFLLPWKHMKLTICVCGCNFKSPFHKPWKCCFVSNFHFFCFYRHGKRLIPVKTSQKLTIHCCIMLILYFLVFLAMVMDLH